MVLFILSYILVAVIATVITRLYIKYFKIEDMVGNLLIVEDEGEPPMLMLEILPGHVDKIKPGNIVRLVVTQNKHPSL